MPVRLTFSLDGEKEVQTITPAEGARGFYRAQIEPVFATLTVPGAKRVTVLDHDGRTTSKKLSVSPEGRFEINGARDKTMYYEITK